MTENFKQPFSIIKHFNSVNDAVTLDGHRVIRQDKMFVREIGRYVKPAPYDNHFIYQDPEALKGRIGRSSLMCTCGSLAVIVGYDAYKQDASASTADEGLIPGEMIVCYIHGNTGKHADDSG